MFEDVAFMSEGSILRGRLYSHEVDDRPTVVMAHGTSATITMAVDAYAEAIFTAGFNVLLYDHKNFGISDGEPRQEINPWIQARGYRDAVGYLRQNRPKGPIALWGDSYTAGLVLVAGALPVVSADQLNAPSLLAPIQAFRWFVEYGGRHGSKWQNLATRVIPDTPVACSPFVSAPYLRMPVQFMVGHNDEMVHCNPDMQRAVYDRIAGQKEFVEVLGGHYGLL
ncbi:MAG: lysophospholipase, partial [Paracoccaceae bacterium]|nr:lysophospholipase [Paracoccaceae bacterium]